MEYLLLTNVTPDFTLIYVTKQHFYDNFKCFSGIAVVTHRLRSRHLMRLIHRPRMERTCPLDWTTNRTDVDIHY